MAHLFNLVILSGLSLVYPSLVKTQSTTYLPPPPLYDDGRFLSPDTSRTQIFSEGSTMNVSWTTRFPSVHLYLLSGTDYNNPTTCLFGSTKTFWEWQVDDNGNNSLPFSFRIVNAEGTDEELRGGGFYKGQFWVKNESKQVSSTESTIDATTTSSSETPSATTPTETSTSSLSATTSSSESTSSTISTAAPASSLTTVENDRSDTTGSGMNTTAIGAGVGAGAGVVITVLAIDIWIFCRRHRRKNKELPTNPPAMFDAKEPNRVYEAYAPSHQQMQAKDPYTQRQGVYEFGAKSPVEAPSAQGHFVELAGSDVNPRTS